MPLWGHFTQRGDQTRLTFLLFKRFFNFSDFSVSFRGDDLCWSVHCARLTGSHALLILVDQSNKDSSRLDLLFTSQLCQSQSISNLKPTTPQHTLAFSETTSKLLELGIISVRHLEAQVNMRNLARNG